MLFQSSMNCLVVSSVSCRTSPAVDWTRDNVVRVRSLMFVSSSLMLLNGLLLLSNCCLNFRELVCVVDINYVILECVAAVSSPVSTMTCAVLS